jgi:protein tyrosine phosphatase
VTHIQYDDWEDMRIPDDKQCFVDFVHFTNKQFQDLKLRGPMVVHCFGGAGRTGTFLTIHITLQKIQRFGGRAIEVGDLIEMMRNERASLVQTPVS